jgi:hypothetical protein
MFIQKWWSSARYFDYHVYTEMMKFYQVFWLMKCCQVFWLIELHHFCINIIVKIPGRTSSFLYKLHSQNTWQNFIWSAARYFDWWSSIMYMYFDWWRPARYFHYHVYTEMMKFCQVFWLSCLYNHFCVNMIVKISSRTSSVKIPGRTSSFLYKHDSQNVWQNFIISV